MHFEENIATDALNITGYSAGKIEINGQSHDSAIIVRENNISPINATTPSELTAEHFLDQDRELPEVILVGTGKKQVFIHPKITATLAAKGIGLESMSTAAACRTFMILQSEGRRVWAWLWV